MRSPRAAKPNNTFRNRGLVEKDLEIKSETESQWRVKLKEGRDIKNSKRSMLAASLRSGGFKIVNRMKDQLDELVRGSFTTVNRSVTELTAKVAERVVIDVIIQSTISHGHLDEKLIRYVRLATSRHGLGHFTENLLAVVSPLSFSLFNHTLNSQ